MPFKFKGKKISEKQYIRLLEKGSTVNLKGFKINSETVEGLIRFDEDLKLVFEPKMKVVKPLLSTLKCPKCKEGTVIKGKTAYGCSNYKSGCDFRISFDEVRAKSSGQKMTKELVYDIFHGRI